MIDIGQLSGRSRHLQKMNLLVVVLGPAGGRLRQVDGDRQTLLAHEG